MTLNTKQHIDVWHRQIMVLIFLFSPDVLFSSFHVRSLHLIICSLPFINPLFLCLRSVSHFLSLLITVLLSPSHYNPLISLPRKEEGKKKKQNSEGGVFSPPP